MNANPFSMNPGRFTTGLDALALQRHLHACQRAQGRTFVLQCIAESLHAALRPRLVTTVAGAVCLMALLGALV